VEMKTSAVAVVAWLGRWNNTGPGTMRLRHHATPRG